MRKLAVIPLLVILLAATTAFGQADLANVNKGLKIARTVCTDCHLVEAGDESDPKMPVRTFQEIAYGPATTEMSLRAFLRTPHRQMPNFVLPEEDTADIVAYILSLK